jgi:hypothetical protein
MGSSKHISTYSTFNDSLTYFSLFDHPDLGLDPNAHSERDAALDTKVAPADIKFPRQFPLTV